jgi:hypothetical protein
MNQGYVYSKQFVEVEELQQLLKELALGESYYFLRSPHTVSGITMTLPQDFPTVEGQMFNATCELRWKKQKSDYDVLILSNSSKPDLKDFEQSDNWETSDFKAYFYENETKFPKDFVYKNLNNEKINPQQIDINQRYFKDAETATVHFIALTLKPPTET